MEGIEMMPLSMAVTGQTNQIIKVGGNDTTRQFLAKLGFVPGASISIITRTGEGLIVSVKESRVAIGSEIAVRIMVNVSNEEHAKNHRYHQQHQHNHHIDEQQTRRRHRP